MATAEAIKTQCEETHRKCASRSSYANFCDRNRQYEDKRAVKATANATQYGIILLGTLRWDWAGVWICAGWKVAGNGAEAGDQAVCGNAL